MNFQGCFISLSVALMVSAAAFAQDGVLEELVGKSRVAMEESRWEQALDFNTEAVTRFGQDQPLKKYGAQFGAIFYHKGICEMKLKRWPEAMRSFEICYRDFPNAGTERANPYQKLALLKWGEAAMGTENWELAMSRFTKFLDERDRTRDTFPQGSFYINKAVCEFRLGRLPEGIENLEIAIRNKADFPTPEPGIVAAFQRLVEVAIANRDEQILMDFIGKNRGALIIEPREMQHFTGVFLKLAGDSLAAGMQRAAIALYQFVPSTDAAQPEIIKLAAIALIHEKNGNLRGAFAAYQQLERYFPDSTNREDYLYHLVRTASHIGEDEYSRMQAGRLMKDFPKSIYLVELREAGIDFPEVESDATQVRPVETGAPDQPLPATREFAAAVDLYQGRKYPEAKAAFREIRERPVSGGSADKETATLATFFETECLRKLGDLAGLADVLTGLEKSPSLGAVRLRQLEINELWELVQIKDWDRLDRLARDWLNSRLPGDQRAQVAYCHGLALEHIGSPTDALNAFNVAMTADVGASEEIARDAALHVLQIHLADPGVLEAIANHGISDADRESSGAVRLEEAASVAALFELSLGAGTPLPTEATRLLKYVAPSNR